MKKKACTLFQNVQNENCSEKQNKSIARRKLK